MFIRTIATTMDIARKIKVSTLEAIEKYIYENID